MCLKRTLHSHPTWHTHIKKYKWCEHSVCSFSPSFPLSDHTAFCSKSRHSDLHARAEVRGAFWRKFRIACIRPILQKTSKNRAAATRQECSQRGRENSLLQPEAAVSYWAAVRIERSLCFQTWSKSEKYEIIKKERKKKKSSARGCIWTLVSPLTRCAILNRSLNRSRPQFPRLKNGTDWVLASWVILEIK